MPQDVTFTVTYEITFNTPDAPDVVKVPEELWKYYRISREELYTTVMGLHYMDDFRDLYVFATDASNPSEGVVEAPEFGLGNWDDGDAASEVYGPIEWTVNKVTIQ
jgi:hypothetical protein